MKHSEATEVSKVRGPGLKQTVTGLCDSAVEPLAVIIKLFTDLLLLRLRMRKVIQRYWQTHVSCCGKPRTWRTSFTFGTCKKPEQRLATIQDEFSSSTLKCTEYVVPGRPRAPLSPCRPGGPRGPCGPGSPLMPLSPGGPGGPWGPGRPVW